MHIRTSAFQGASSLQCTPTRFFIHTTQHVHVAVPLLGLSEHTTAADQHHQHGTDPPGLVFAYLDSSLREGQSAHQFRDNQGLPLSKPQ